MDIGVFSYSFLKKGDVSGYKLLVLMEARHKIVVAARVVKINEHEKNFTKEMIREAQHRGRAGS